MTNFFKNSWIFIIFLIAFLFKEKIYNLFYPKNYDFTYLKEVELNYYKDEYQKLLDIYNINLNENNDYILTKIIYRDIYNFYNEFTIAKGNDFGLKKGDIIVSPNSLVGVISKVDKNSSKVASLYNKNLKISVKVNDSYGILESKNDKLYVNNIVSQANINIGDIVYTSGLTTIQENIPIAIVKNIKETKDNISKIIEVKEISNLKDLEYVMIVKKEGND